MLIGDSHARQWVPALDNLAQRYGYTAYFLIREGCPSSDVTPWMVNGGPSTDCEAFQEWARDQVEEMQPEVVLLGSEANRRGFATDDGERVDDVPTMTEMYQEGMERQIDYLAPNTQRVIVIGDPPAVTVHPGRCLSERDASLKTCLSTEDEVSLVFIDALRQAALAKGVQFVETAAWFCAEGLCPSVVGAVHRPPRPHPRQRDLRGLPDRRARGADPPRAHRRHGRRAVTGTSPGVPHRDDIQGLRAIAVLTVIASHAGVPFLHGGFVGVDVFFVISGFLITQLLLREVEKSGRLSIPAFYARRARRILPAATLVTIATSSPRRSG